MSKLIARCPCGKGRIERNVFHFGNNAIFEPTVHIICPNCHEKYKVFVLDNKRSSQDQGRNTKCYLIPKEFDDKIPYDYSIQPIKENHMTLNEFPNYIACIFNKEKLNIALQEFKTTEDKICLRNYAKAIYNNKKAYLFDDEIPNLIEDVTTAIELYDTYKNNYDALKKQEAKNKKIEEHFYNKIEEVGILFKGRCITKKGY